MLIAAGAIAEDEYVAAFAKRHGIPFEPLSHRTRAECPVSDAQLIEAAVTGLLPLTVDDDLAFVVVPRLVDSRRLAAALAAPTELTRRIRVTSLPRLQRFVAHHAAREIGHRAERALHEVRPELSARGKMLPILTLTVLALLIAIGGWAAPYATLMASEIALAALFLAWSGLRIFGLCSERLMRRRRRTIRDDLLPTYTVIVPLYREAAALSGLIAALQRLDYPVEKLDIKLVVEADDRQTREALARLHLGASFEVVIAPRSGPRTKPKALNAALPFARGSFIAIYDAEDRPEPDQLRVALEAFSAGDERLACVQARLTIDNTADSWLARLFTAEYAGLFDVFLPGLAAWRLPLPLGGSSNHFRASVLRAVGALGSIQCHRGCRSRHAACAFRLPHDGHPVHHLRGGAGALSAVDQAAHALVQRLAADLAGAHACTTAAVSRTGLAGLCRVPAGGRRHGAGRADSFAVRG